MVAPPTTPRSFAIDVARVSAAFQDLARQMNAQFLDKQEIIRLMTISAIAGEHLVIVGPPGTAKSAMIDMFAKLIDARYFEYLLTRFTEPNELFGPVDIAAFREGRYTRRLDSMQSASLLVRSVGRAPLEMTMVQAALCRDASSSSAPTMANGTRSRERVLSSMWRNSVPAR